MKTAEIDPLRNLKPIHPQDPPSFAEFQDELLRVISSRLGIPHDMLTGEWRLPTLPGRLFLPPPRSTG